MTVPKAQPPPAQVNGTHNHNHTHSTQKGKKKAEPPLDPATMYESLKNRIAALEEEEVHADEEERRFGAPLNRETFYL